MFLRKSLAITTILGILSLPLLASATKILIRTDCLHPTQGAGVCELEFPSPADPNIWDVVWQDKTKTRIRFPKKTDRKNTSIQLFNSQSNKWIDSANVGICFDRRCLHFFSYAELKNLKQQSSRITIGCSDPTIIQSTCQVEYVPSTDGLRVYWADGSIEHYRWKDTPLKWSHVKNNWMKVSSWGGCLDRLCLFFDSEIFNHWSKK